jgi:hypothetical protein
VQRIFVVFWLALRGALAIVNLVDCRPMTPQDARAEGSEHQPGRDHLRGSCGPGLDDASTMSDKQVANLVHQTHFAHPSQRICRVAADDPNVRAVHDANGVMFIARYSYAVDANIRGESALTDERWKLPKQIRTTFNQWTHHTRLNS